MIRANVATNPSGGFVSLRVNSSGELIVALSGGGGGGGDASAANQALEIAALGNIYDNNVQILGQVFTVAQNLIDLQTVDTLFSAKFPAAATPANNTTAPSTTAVRAILGAIEPNGGKVYNLDCDTSRRLQVVANGPGTATNSNSTTWQAQRRAAAFGCTVRRFRAFSRAAAGKYVVLVDSSTTIANGDMPKGACVYKVATADGVGDVFPYGMSFSNGCCIALCDSVDPTITLSSADALFTVQLD